MTEQILDERELVKRLRQFVRVNPKRSAGALRQWLNADPQQGTLVFDPLAAHLVVLLDERASSVPHASRPSSCITTNSHVGEVSPQGHIVWP